MNYAGLSLRFAAFVIDLLIVQMLAVMTMTIAGMLAALSIQSPDVASWAEAIAWVSAVLLQWLYFTLPEASPLQATPGKLLMEIKVVSDNGQPITLRQANQRYIGKLATIATFFIGFIIAAFSKQKHALHDFWPKTSVIKSDNQKSSFA